MRSEIAQAVESLIKSGNADNEPQRLSVPGQLQVLDIYPHMRHLFSPAAQLTLNNVTNNTIYQYNEACMETPEDKLVHLLAKLSLKSSETKANYIRKADVVRYFGSLASTQEQIPQAVEKIISTINTVADLGFTKATLYGLGIVQIFPEPLKQEYIVFSYVTLTETGKIYAETNLKNMLTEEGAIPKRVEDQ
jgi:hypothetical protein